MKRIVDLCFLVWEGWVVFGIEVGIGIGIGIVIEGKAIVRMVLVSRT